MLLSIETTEQMEALGAAFAHAITPHCLIFLSGELGTGKTTLVRGFLRALGHSGAVKSPTYSLVELYTLPTKTIAHFDLYRLVDPEELEWIGLREYLSHTDACLIEWPELGSGRLPCPDVQCTIELPTHHTVRTVQLIAMSEEGKRVLHGIAQV